MGPVPSALGTPVSTKPATGVGVFNSTADLTATKVLSAATSHAGALRRVTIANPNAAAYLAWTTVVKGTAAPTLTAGIAATATDGRPIPPGEERTFLLNEMADLYLAASVAATPYSLTVEDT